MRCVLNERPNQESVAEAMLCSPVVTRTVGQINSMPWTEAQPTCLGMASTCKTFRLVWPSVVLCPKGQRIPHRLEVTEL